MNKSYQKYKNTSIQSASKEKLLLMMYEGAIKFVKLSIIAVEKNDISARGLNIGRAYDIVLELNNTLNHDVGGELAASLEQLYGFVTEKLTEANIGGKKEPLEDALKILNNLYSGWKEAIQKLKQDAEL